MRSGYGSGVTIAVELAVQDAAGTQIAGEVGASRVELCSALGMGGLTPSTGVIQACVDAAAPMGIDVHVLIRPRAGGFVFTAAEAAVMHADVRHAIAAGAAGVVIGALTPQGGVDTRITADLVAAAGGRDVTFHRAIDLAADPVPLARTLLDFGITRILTSGGAPTAAAGARALTRLVHAVRGRIQIMAGAGITPETIAAVAATGVDAVHFSAKETIPGDQLALGAADHGGYDRTDADLARRIVAALPQ